MFYPEHGECTFISSVIVFEICRPPFLTIRKNTCGCSVTLDDVREEWERVKFSYEILSDPKTRKKYDRNSSAAEELENPGGAVGRAVASGAMNGVGFVLGGAWKLGESVVKAIR